MAKMLLTVIFPHIRWAFHRFFGALKYRPMVPSSMPRFSKRTADALGPLGRLLYSGRRAADRNVETCAADCGLSESFLHFVEQGRRAPALNLILGIADAYKVDRRQAAWAWILQTAPDVAIYLVSHETVAGEPMLQRHFSEQYEERVRAREDARKAEN